jgi:hypothetical protein
LKIREQVQEVAGPTCLRSVYHEAASSHSKRQGLGRDPPAIQYIYVCAELPRPST